MRPRLLQISLFAGFWFIMVVQSTSGQAQPVEGENDVPSPACEALNTLQNLGWGSAYETLSSGRSILNDRGDDPPPTQDFRTCYPADDGAWGFVVSAFAPDPPGDDWSEPDVVTITAAVAFCDEGGVCHTSDSMDLNASGNTDFANDQDLYVLGASDLNNDGQSDFVFRLETNRDGPIGYEPQLMTINASEVISMTLPSPWLTTARIAGVEDVNEDGLMDVAFFVGETVFETVHGPYPRYRAFSLWALQQPGAAFEVDTPTSRRLASLECPELEPDEIDDHNDSIWTVNLRAVSTSILCSRLGLGAESAWDIWQELTQHPDCRDSSDDDDDSDCARVSRAMWPWMLFAVPFEETVSDQPDPCYQWASWVRDRWLIPPLSELNWIGRRVWQNAFFSCRPVGDTAWGLWPVSVDGDEPDAAVSELSLVTCSTTDCQQVTTITGTDTSYREEREVQTLDFESDGDTDMFVHISSNAFSDAALVLNSSEGFEVREWTELHPLLQADNVTGIIDYDEDGLMDLTFLGFRHHVQLPDHDRFVTGPHYLAHALADGGYSIDDETAWQWLEAWCADVQINYGFNSAVNQVQCAELLGQDHVAVFDALNQTCEEGGHGHYCDHMDVIEELTSLPLPISRP